MITIREHLVGLPVRGTWWRWRSQVFVACPTCGSRALLDHEIARDGTVTPSVECPAVGCSFHEMVRLEGWAPAPHHNNGRY